MEKRRWECPKCESYESEQGQFAATGGGISKFFNLQNKKFSTITCKKCKFTEIYQTKISMLSKVFDFLGG